MTHAAFMSAARISAHASARCVFHATVSLQLSALRNGAMQKDLSLGRLALGESAVEIENH